MKLSIIRTNKEKPIVVCGNRAREFPSLEDAKAFKEIAEIGISIGANEIDKYNDAYQFLILGK